MSGLRHNALVYESDDEYVTRSVAFLRAGLERGEGGVVANTRSGLAVIREALGSEAAGVTFVDVGAAYTRPARTLAAYHQVYAEELKKAASVRVVADVQFGPDPAEWNIWMGYEAALTRCFAHLPTWVMCTYNANGLPDPILEAVWRTHTDVLAGDGWTESRQFENPTELLREVTREPEPLTELRSIPCGRDAEAFRERLAHELGAEKVPEAKALDMLIAGTEIFANAEGHGGGVEAVRVGRAKGRFVCEVVDRGSGFDDPAAGYLAPREGVGTGLWIARRLTWELEFFGSPQGFTARTWL